MYTQTDPQKWWMMHRAFTHTYFRGYFSQKIYNKSQRSVRTGAVFHSTMETPAQH